MQLPRRGYVRWQARDVALRLRDRAVTSGGLPGVAPRLLTLLSPHLDDAVLSCGQVLAAHPGATVVTVFSGGPPRWDELTGWNRDCGFSVGDDVVAARRAEDVAALAVVGARPRWFDLPELQYGVPSTDEDVRAAVRAALPTRPGSLVLAPLGVHHADHEQLGRVVVAVAAERPELDWHLYDDLPYRDHHADAYRRRLGEVRGLVPAALPSAPVAFKRAAVRKYRSQVRGLHEWLAPAFGREGYWKLGAA